MPITLLSTPKLMNGKFMTSVLKSFTAASKKAHRRPFLSSAEDGLNSVGQPTMTAWTRHRMTHVQRQANSILKASDLDIQTREKMRGGFTQFKKLCTIRAVQSSASLSTVSCMLWWAWPSVTLHKQKGLALWLRTRDRKAGTSSPQQRCRSCWEFALTCQIVWQLLEPKHSYWTTLRQVSHLCRG